MAHVTPWSFLSELPFSRDEADPHFHDTLIKTLSEWSKQDDFSRTVQDATVSFVRAFIDELVEDETFTPDDAVECRRALRVIERALRHEGEGDVLASAGFREAFGEGLNWLLIVWLMILIAMFCFRLNAFDAALRELVSHVVATVGLPSSSWTTLYTAGYLGYFDEIDQYLEVNLGMERYVPEPLTGAMNIVTTQLGALVEFYRDMQTVSAYFSDEEPGPTARELFDVVSREYASMWRVLKALLWTTGVVELRLVKRLIFALGQKIWNRMWPAFARLGDAVQEARDQQDARDIKRLKDIDARIRRQPRSAERSPVRKRR